MGKYIFIFTAAATAFIFYSFTVFNQPGNEVSPPGKNGLAIPDDVQQIIDNHCFGCHNSDSKNEKSRKKLKFDKLTNMNKAKQIGKLGKIADVIKNDEMPRKNFFKRDLSLHFLQIKRQRWPTGLNQLPNHWHIK